MAAATRSGVWVLIGLSTVAAASCNAVLGIQEYPAGAEGPNGGREASVAEAGLRACGIETGGGKCAACVQAKCCPQAEACAGNSACAAYEDCLVPCGGDYACRSRCQIGEYATAREIPRMDQCMAEGCASECGLLCKTAGSYAEPDAATMCEQCLTASNCSAAEQCGTNLECQEIVQCGTECASLDCVWACGTGKEAGAALFNAYAIGGASCGGACGAGKFWDCPRASGPSVTQVGQTTLTLNFTVLPSGQPFANAIVKACNREDAACATPVAAPGKTDAQGNVTFVLPALGALGFAGYFDISSPSTYPTLYFLQAPLSVPQVTLPAPPLAAPSLFQGFYTTYGATPNPSRGIIEIEATDCHWYPAPNVTAQADLAGAGVSLAYFVNGTLTPTATATDGLGYAVLLNAPAGPPVTLSVTPRSVGHPTSTVTLFARPQTLSFMFVHPD